MNKQISWWWLPAVIVAYALMATFTFNTWEAEQRTKLEAVNQKWKQKMVDCGCADYALSPAIPHLLGLKQISLNVYKT